MLLRGVRVGSKCGRADDHETSLLPSGLLVSKDIFIRGLHSPRLGNETGSCYA